jgi:hypothetical protein
MEDIIKRIINIEEKAQQIVENTAEEEKDFELSLEDKVEKLHREIQAKADTKITELNLQESAGDAKEETRLRTSAQQSAAFMQQLYQQKKEQWVEGIFQAIVGR